MGHKRKLVSITARIARERTDIDPSTVKALVEAGRVFVGGAPVTNPRALVPQEARLVIDDDAPLRGTAKLRAALARFTPQIAGKVALDLGACTGGFTTALLEAGAARVYAVEAGFGQLLGSLRLDPRVVNLEKTNLGALDEKLVPDVVDVVVADLSYVSLARAFGELDRVRFAEGAEAVVLVKPQFELGLDHAPVDDESVARAVLQASIGLSESGWRVVGAMRSPHPGAGGAVEAFVHVRRR